MPKASTTNAARWAVDVSRVTAVRRNGEQVLLRPKERAVVTAIAFTHPQPATIGDIAPLVWGDKIPATANKAIHNHIARLRRSIEGLIDTSAYGYRLAETVDVIENTTDVDAEPFADLATSPAVTTRRDTVADGNSAMQEAEVEALIGRGEHVAAIPQLDELLRQAPGRPRRWWLLMLAQLRSGRRTDALATYVEATSALANVGKQPGTQLDQLRQHLIDDDPVVLSATYLDRGRTSTEAARSLAGGDPIVMELPGPFSTIEEALNQARGPVPTAPSVCLIGPAGSGKSTFIRTVVAAASAQGFQVYATQCSPEPNKPLEPFSDLINQVARNEPARLSRVRSADALASLLPQMDSSAPAMLHGDRTELFDTVGDVLLGSDRPTLVVIEDVHFAPPLTTAALEHVHNTRDYALAPFVLLTTVRTEDSTESNNPFARSADHVVELEPWSTNTIAAYLGQFDVSPAWAETAAEWVEAQTAGNPLFVREMALIAANTAQGSQRDTFVPPAEVPDAVRTAIHHRMSLLSRHALAVVQAAAVLGVRFDGTDVSDMLDAATSGLAEARSVGVIQPGAGSNGFEFRHQLYHREVLDNIAPAIHAELSDLAARTIDESSAPSERSGEIARHSLAAASLDLNRAVGATKTAADLAVRAQDHGEAAALYSAAMQAIDDIEGRNKRWCDMAIAAGRHRLASGEPDGIEVLYRVVDRAEELGELDQLARATLEICRLGPTTEAGEVNQRAAVLVERVLDSVTDDATRAVVCGAATMVHNFDPTTDTVRAYYEQAEQHARASGRDDVLAEIMPFSYMSLSAPDDLDRRERNADELMELGEKLDRPDTTWEALHLRLSNQTQRGAGDIRATHDELEHVARRLHEQSRGWEMAYIRSCIALFDGDLAEAEAQANTSLSFDGAVGTSIVFAAYGAHILAIRIAQSAVAELFDMLQQLAADQPGVAAWKPALAFAAAEAGHLELARNTFDDVMADYAAELPRDHTFTVSALVLGETAARLGDPKRVAGAQELLSPLQGRWSWCGTCTFGPIDLTLARLALALGDLAEAQQLAVGALASCAELRAPVYSAQAGNVIAAALA